MNVYSWPKKMKPKSERSRGETEQKQWRVPGPAKCEARSTSLLFQQSASCEPLCSEFASIPWLPLFFKQEPRPLCSTINTQRKRAALGMTLLRLRLPTARQNSLPPWPFLNNCDFVTFEVQDTYFEEYSYLRFVQNVLKIKFHLLVLASFCISWTVK